MTKLYINQPPKLDTAKLLEQVNSISRVDDSQEVAHRMLRKQADKILRKNRTELNRLRSIAEKALMTGNKEQYIYAIGKSRDLLKQPYTEQLLSTMWETSVQTLVDKVSAVKERGID